MKKQQNLIEQIVVLNKVGKGIITEEGLKLFAEMVSEKMEIPVDVIQKSFNIHKNVG